MKRPRAPAPELDFRSWIIFEDEWLLAVDKPAGVLSQGGEGGEGINLVDLARVHLSRPSGIGVLHRLDRNVSGVVLLAKDPRAAGKLTAAFAKGQVERVYEAIVRVLRAPSNDSFTVDAWLRKDEARNEVEARSAAQLALLSAPVRAQFRESKTEVCVIERLAPALGPCARCEVRPITGRSHQIRVHLAFVGLPIVGDPKYGAPARGLHRPLLHATRVRFVHPRTNKPVEITCPVPWSDRELAALAPAAR